MEGIVPKKARVMSPKETSEVHKLAAVLNKKQLSDYFGMSENTLERLMKRQPEVMEAYKKGVADAISDIGGSLVAKARDGDLGAMIFYLKCRANWKEKTEVDIQAVVQTNHTLSFEDS